ncbi:MAG: HDIG domain-containing protein [Chloroflexi bacterium]|nr:HDIG domain-containing protein [Chloroflexota bacterium]
MQRQEAVASIQAKVKNQNTVKHMLATEAIMMALARRLGQDEDAWGLAGLVHDIDLELIQGDMQTHSRSSAEMAREMGASDEICQAILCHNEAHGISRQSLMDKALWCADPLTGLIVAGALVRPDKKLAGLDVSSLVKRFGEKRFAAGASREQIASCVKIGLEMEEFLSLGLEAMKGIAPELGL